MKSLIYILVSVVMLGVSGCISDSTTEDPHRLTPAQAEQSDDYVPWWVE